MLLGLSLALSCILALVVSQGTVDPNDCQDVSGPFGVEVYCPAGMVAVGACGSGKNEDCEGNSHILRCCRVSTANTELAACIGVAGNHGDDYECPLGQQIISLCGSGRNPDCGVNDIYAKSTCCDGNGITTNETSFCRWSFANYGQFHFCAPSEVMVGFCGSGANEDCDDFSTKIKCCSYF